MKEIAMHIQDIAENSIRAGAGCIDITITEDAPSDQLRIKISDDGEGMDENTLKKALDPFFTTKTVRKVGMGLSLFKQAAVRTGGDMTIQSTPGKGTNVEATFKLSHIDRQPLGDMASAIITLLMAKPEIDIFYRHERNGDVFIFDTKLIKSTLDGISISESSVIQFVRQIITERQNLESEE